MSFNSDGSWNHYPIFISFPLNKDGEYKLVVWGTGCSSYYKKDGVDFFGTFEEHPKLTFQKKDDEFCSYDPFYSLSDLINDERFEYSEFIVNSLKERFGDGIRT